MPTVTTIEGSRLGYNDDEHMDRIGELLEEFDDDLDSVIASRSCREQYEHLLRARDVRGEISGHADGLTTGGSRSRDSDLADELLRLEEKYVELEREFGKRCVR